MPRALSLLIAIGIIATAGYFSWKLVFDRPAPRPIPPVVPDAPVSRPGPVKPETRVVSAPPAVVDADGVPAIANRIEGTVYDEAGAPVPDAEVQIVHFELSRTSTRPPDRRFAEKVLASTATSEKGRYVFDNLVPEEVKSLRVLKDGFVTQMKAEVRVPAVSDFNLVRGVPVRGKVVAEGSEAPIEGVGVKGWFKKAAEPGKRAFWWMEEVFSNKSGEFAFEGAPPGEVLFMLAHPEYVDVSERAEIVPGAKNELSFTMKPGLVIEGIVMHATKNVPVPKLEVSGKDNNPLLARWTTTTDENGVFRMKGVRPGKVLFEIQGRGFSPARQAVNLDEANDFTGSKRGRRVEFSIQPAGRAAGKIVTAHGDPIAGARVFVATVQSIFVVVRDPAQHGGSMQDGETRTDEQGRFLVDDIVAVPHRIVAEAPGYGLAATTGFEVGPDEIRDNVDLVLNAAPAIKGIVTDEHHVPVKDALITVELPQYADVWFPPGFDLGQKAQRTLITDASGRFRIDVPYSGKYRMRVDHPDYVLVDGVVVTLKDYELETTQDFMLKHALTVAGTVTGPSGAGEADAEIRAWKEGIGDPVQTKSGKDGTYSLNRLEAGLYRINAKKTAGKLSSQFKDEVPAGSSGIDFVLVPTGEVVGAVTDATGAPVSEFQLSLTPMAERPPARGEQRKRSTAGLTQRQEEQSDPGGLFRIPDVDPGRWSLQVTSPLHAPSAPVEVVVAGGGPVSVGTIVLKTGGAITGRIAGPGGTPVEGALISVNRLGDLPDPSGNPTPPVPQRAISGRSGPNGQFALRGLLPGEYLVRVESDKYVDPPQERLLVADGATLDRSYTLKVSATVAVVVKDEVGEPTPQVIVTVVDSAMNKIPYPPDGPGGATTDRTGRINLRKLPAGEDLKIRLVRAGYEVEEVAQKLKEGDNGVVELRIRRLNY